MSEIKLVFFDFDGVVLDSARIKTKAFPVVFAEYPEHGEAITKYHLDNQGISRYEKFQWIYDTLLEEELTEEKSIELGETFSEIVLDEVLKCDEIPGALEFLNFLKNKSIPAVVASGTPYKELNTIIHKRELDHYFVDVWGSPKLKDEIIEILISIHGLKPEECLFLGDASTDYMAASKMSIPFQAVYSSEMKKYWNEVGESTISNLMELTKRF
ncbi:MAG: haloacid dehalogenase [Bacteroidetes bacterium]|nr:MAG: haloacid dehalogenase [Bacteroidota bacterium]